MYDRIFSGQVVEPYIIALLLDRAAKDWVLKSGYTETADDLRRKLANNGVFHLARAAAFLWRGSDSWSTPTEKLKDQIKTLEADSAALSDVFGKALEILEGIFKANTQYSSDVDTALKSTTLETDLDKALHSLTPSTV
jgi:hypothetical protein